MTWAEEISAAFGEFGEDAVIDEGFGPVSVTIPAPRWTEAVRLARDRLGCAFFDWLSAVDELAEGFSVVCHVARPGAGPVDHLLVRTRVPRDQPGLSSVVGVYAGAAWHERETHEMFGISFDGQDTAHLLLPEEFEGHPLRKDFVLASRVAKPWPGAKEPGESHEGEAPSRRRMRPPGVPEPEQWGPRDPGSETPDPLAHSQPGPARPPRRQRPERRAAPEGAASRDVAQDSREAEPEGPVERSRAEPSGPAQGVAGRQRSSEGAPGRGRDRPAERPGRAEPDRPVEPSQRDTAEEPGDG